MLWIGISVLKEQGFLMMRHSSFAYALRRSLVGRLNVRSPVLAIDSPVTSGGDCSDAREAKRRAAYHEPADSLPSV